MTGHLEDEASKALGALDSNDTRDTSSKALGALAVAQRHIAGLSAPPGPR